ncbi:MAG: glycosyltransferase [Prevotella sp.]|nr:glycosyltransferase [Prevotella sp.]
MAKEYTQLLDSYHRMFEMIDAFHFNSQNTADVYERHLKIPKASKVIPITHRGIQDRRKYKKFNSCILRLGFIGSEAPYKGLPMLKEAIAKLNEEGHVDKLLLNVYGGRTGKDDHLQNMEYKGRFTSDMMEKVFDEMDLLVVPSICHETFSLVTMEALSFGTPVLVSDKVGAKDVVRRYAPNYVFSSKSQLLELLLALIQNNTSLRNYNEKIVNSQWDYSLEKHSREIVSRLYI